jgi:predicted CoA-binding protein
MNTNVAILGASDNPDRYAFLAQERLLSANYSVFPIHPKIESILGVNCLKSLSDLEPHSIHTLTLYVRAEISSSVQEQIFALKPQRVIFNPGTENPSLQSALAERGIQTLEACTLVMLAANNF